VLTGMIAGLLGLGLDESESARLGVYVHGLAGELAEERTGSHGLLASDLAEAIGGVMGGGSRQSIENGENKKDETI